jgi:hypothetical protein
MKGNILSLINRTSMLGAAAGVLLLPSQSSALVMLSDDGSTATIDLNSAAGMNSWTVLGQNQLNQQWFWYRIGNTVAQPISSISAPNIAYQDANTVVAEYANATLSVWITYILNGSGAGNADITELINVVNNSGSTLQDFNLFQYSDFNLLDTPGGDSVSISMSGGGYDYVYQSKGATEIQEAITAPSADGAEAAYAYTTLFNLNNVAGYNLDGTTVVGPGDVTWSLQWTRDIGVGEEFDVTKDKALHIVAVPEPTTLTLGLLALGGLLVRRRL